MTQQLPPPPGVPAGPVGRPGFDPKTINPLDWGIIAAGVLALIFSLIDFYDGANLSADGRSVDVDTPGFTAWHEAFGGGFFSWFAMIFAILGAAAVAADAFAPEIKIGIANRLAGLGLFALATVFEIIGIFVTPGVDLAGFNQSVSVSLNHGFGFWASLVVILVGTVLSLMRFQATGGQVPGTTPEARQDPPLPLPPPLPPPPPV